jgi:hypothetical protein
VIEGKNAHVNYLFRKSIPRQLKINYSVVGKRYQQTKRGTIFALSGNEAIENGERDRPGRSIRRPAECLLRWMVLLSVAGMFSARGRKLRARRPRSQDSYGPVKGARQIKTVSMVLVTGAKPLKRFLASAVPAPG